MEKRYFSRLRKNSVIHKMPLKSSYDTDVTIVSGCSEWPSGKAVTSEEVRCTLRDVESLSDARRRLTDFFQHPGRGVGRESCV